MRDPAPGWRFVAVLGCQALLSPPAARGKATLSIAVDPAQERVEPDLGFLPLGPMVGTVTMRSREFIRSEIFQSRCCPIVLALSAFWAVFALASFRWLPALICVAAIAIHSTRKFHCRAGSVVVVWFLFLTVCLSPADISFRSRRGPPKFVPLEMGLIVGLSEEQERGDVVLGGCLATGYEPRWLLVW